ncbi:MAG: bphO [Myxococcales bacterium]|nr:bphO [Myxococcales bacterium]
MAAYRAYLTSLYGFESPFEEALALSGHVALGFVAPRIKTGRIADDLLALGLTAADFVRLSRRQHIDRFSSAAQSLGWLYVIERLTLHHGALRDHLAATLPDELAVAGSYLAAYDGDTGDLWRELRLELEHVARSPAAADRMVAAAHEAFACQIAWLEQAEGDGSVLVMPLHA